MEHPEYGEVIQLQGDQRTKVADFLKKVGLATEAQLKVNVVIINCCAKYQDFGAWYNV